MSPDFGYPRQEYPPLPEADHVPWKYDMRRQMQEIIPNLFLGPYASATKNKYDVLTELGITHIVCVRQVVERHIIRPNFPETFQYLIIEMADNCFERIIVHCKSTCDFLTDCLDKGGKALVHGNAGACRSAALVIAFIMYRYGVNVAEAFKYVQSRRFCINPNDNFMAQLKEFEPIYKAQAAVQGTCSSNIPKRKISECNAEIVDGFVTKTEANFYQDTQEESMSD